jgi:hypothetical protein
LIERAIISEPGSKYRFRLQAVEADLMQASAIVASLVDQASNRAEQPPRKPLPAALPPKRDPSSR